MYHKYQRFFIKSGLIIGIVSFGCSIATPVQAGSQPQVVSAQAQAALHQAYVGQGGAAVLGEAQTATPQTAPLGCWQVFRSDGRDSALTAPGCGSQVILVQPDVWEYAQQIDQAEVGLPVATAIPLSDSLAQDFTGGSWGDTKIIAAAEATFAVRGQILTYYEDAINATKLGAPISEQYEWQGEQRQDFSGGSVIWRPEAGARVLQQWANGQILHAASHSAAGFLIQDQKSYTFRDADHLARCRAGQTVVELDQASINATLSLYPASGAAEDCQSAQERAAIARALAEKNSPAPGWSDQLGAWWSGRCETFVELAYGVRFKAASAMTHYQYRASKGSIRTDIQPPAGAFVFYGGSSDGHVGIALGNGQVVSTQGYSGEQKPVWQHRVTGLSNPYLGWARYDGTWP